MKQTLNKPVGLGKSGARLPRAAQKLVVRAAQVTRITHLDAFGQLNFVKAHPFFKADTRHDNMRFCWLQVTRIRPLRALEVTQSVHNTHKQPSNESESLQASRGARKLAFFSRQHYNPMFHTKNRTPTLPARWMALSLPSAACPRPPCTPSVLFWSEEVPLREAPLAPTLAPLERWPEPLLSELLVR